MAGEPRPAPDADLLQRFAQDLRNLRMRAGDPDYRSMARRAGCAPSTLSTADDGRKLPTLRTTMAYVRACGGSQTEQEAWANRWHTLKFTSGQSHQPSSNEDDAPENPTASTVDAASFRTVPESGSTHATPPRRHRVTWLVGIGAGLAVTAIVITSALVITNLSHPGADPSSPSGPAQSSTPLVPGQDVPILKTGTLVITPGRVADLDSPATDWNEQPDPGPNTANIWFDEDDHALHGNGNNDIALLPAGSIGGFWQCAREENYGVIVAGPDISPGRLLCGLTAANHVAQLRITKVHHSSAGTPDQITFDVTVWTPPHKT